ncbi:MAG TPA: transporter substrate-binding domain-containing protein [Devosia sp.]|nr:transporter substrate-binding domain-containing protein [Devosia sp.]
MKSNNLILAATAALALFAAGPAMADSKDWTTTGVTIAMEGAYAPWNLTNPDGTIGGFEPELAQVLCAHMKVKCTVVPSDFDSIIEGLNSNKFDAVMDSLSITPEREKVIAFSIPYANTPTSFETTKGSSLENLAGTGTTIKLTGDAANDTPLIAKFKDAFKGKTIGVQAATVYTKFLDDNFGDIATIREYKTTSERDLDLIAGRIDAGFDDATAEQAAFATAGNESLEFTGPTIGGTIFGPGQGVGLRQSDTQLKALFDDAIKAALADGTVKTLSEKWFKLDVEP